MRLTLKNLSPLPRTAWSQQIGVPLSSALASGIATFVADDGRRFPAVRGEDVGLHSATYRIRATMGGSERLHGTLVADAPPSLPALQFHRWVTDNWLAIVPVATLLTPDGLVKDCMANGGIALEGPKIISSSPAHVRAYGKSANAELGLVQEMWMDLCADDPVVHLWGLITWSNRWDPELTRQHNGALGLVSGEQLALDFATRHGWPYTEFQGKKAVLMAQNPTWKDGGSIPFSGSVLCFRSLEGPWTPSGEDEADIKNLQAAKQGPILGICQGFEWDGRWLAAKSVPKVPQRFTTMAPEQFATLLQQPADLFVARPVGCAKYPGQTGDQPDFGTCKGTRALLFWEPEQLYMARYSVQADCFRGVRHFEKDGTSLNPGNHPQWVTWGGVTHYHTGVSPDRLGKTAPGLPFPAMGDWAGYDDEHESQNWLAFYLALTGDPMMTTQWIHQTTTEVCKYVARFNATMAMRAEGRTTQVYTNMALLLPEQARRNAKYLIDQRVGLWKNHYLLNVAGPMKLLAYHDVDGRKPIYDDNGNLTQTATIWELGLLLVGVVSLLKSGEATDQPGLQAVVTALCRTMATYGCFQNEQGWQVVGDIEWRGGADVPLSEAAPIYGTPIVVGQRLQIDEETGEVIKIGHTDIAMSTAPGASVTEAPIVGYKRAVFANNAGDVRSWTMAGIIAAAEHLATADPTLAQKCRDCMAAMGVNLQSPPDETAAEWWAVVRA